MSEGLRYIDLQDDEWGEIKLLVAIPRSDNHWGVFDKLRGTTWERQIPTVSGEALSHALHGWAAPLMREIGARPEIHARRIPDGLAWCPQKGLCPLAGNQCRPGHGVPECYEPPGLEGEAAGLATRVALAWREGRYVLVVDGPEFSFS